MAGSAHITSAWKAPLKRCLAALGYRVVRLEASPSMRAEPAPPEPPGEEPAPLPDGMVPGTPLPLWEDDAPFQALRRELDGRAIVGEVDSYLLFQLARQVLSLRGDAAEVGVYRGGTARILAKAVEPAGKLVHLFDTFTGMPPTDPARDLYHKAGDFADTSLDTVREFLADCPNVRLHPGLFPDTAAPVADRSFCLVHVDADIYRSVLACCRFFYPRLVAGGLMLFDDYGRRSCPGAKTAVDEFFADRPERPVYLPSAQAFVVKL